MKIITTRRISQIFFLVLFLWFCIVTTLGEQWWQLRGWPVNWLLELDPLVGLGTLLTTGTLYKGLAWGRIHWVAIVPEFQGRGLAKPLLTAVMNRMVELGHQRARLATATQRLPAINLYLKFGFLPDPRNEEELSAWEEIRQILGADRFDIPKP